MDIIFYILNSAAVIIAVVAWYKITALRKRVPGGIVKSTCNLLGEFIGLFIMGFLVFPLFPVLPEGARQFLVGVVFVCAAAFTLVVINFFDALAEDAGF